MIPLFGPILLRGTSVGIATEFGGAAPHALSEYYRGGATGYVVAGASPKIATAGAQAFSNYRGAVLPVVAPPTPGPGGVVTPPATPQPPMAPTAIPELAPGWRPAFSTQKYVSVTFYNNWTSSTAGWVTVLDLNDVFINGPFTLYDLAFSNRRDRAPIQASKFQITAAGLLQVNMRRDTNMNGETINIYVENAVGRSVEYLTVRAELAGTTYSITSLPFYTASQGAPQPKPQPPVTGTSGQAVGSSGTQGRITSTFQWRQTGTNDWIFPTISDEFQSNMFTAATDGYGFAINQMGLYQEPGTGSCYMTLAFSGRPTGKEYQINVVFNGNPPLMVNFVSAANGWTGDSYVYGPFNFGPLVRSISPLPGSGSFSAIQI